MSAWSETGARVAAELQPPASFLGRHSLIATEAIEALLEDDDSKSKLVEFVQDLERNRTIPSMQRMLDTWKELMHELRHNENQDQYQDIPAFDKVLVSINQHLNDRNSKHRMSLPLADQNLLLLPGTILENENDNGRSAGKKPVRKVDREVKRNQSFTRFFNTILRPHVESGSAPAALIPPSEAQARLSFRSFPPIRLFFVGRIEVPLENRSRYPHLFLHPDAKVRLIWNAFMMLSIAYFAVVLPFRAAFELSENSDSLFACETFLDCCYVIEIVLNFLTVDVHNRHQGRIVYDFRLIARNYLKSWFIWDLLSVMPFDILSNVSATESATHFFRLVKVVRMIRIVRLMRLSKYMNDYHSGSRILKTIGLLVAAAHIFACIWISLITYETSEGLFCWEDAYSVPMRTRSAQYVTALYFVVATIGTIGFGDIVPVTSIEKVYTTLLMVFSLTMFAYFIGNISSIISGWGSADADFKGHIRNLKLFMEKEDLPKEMRSRLLAYHDYCFKRNGSFPFTDPSVTDDLSPALKAEVTAFLNKDVINHVPILKALRQDIVQAMLQVLKHDIYGPHDVITHEGDIGTEMYFLKKGRVLVSWRGAGQNHKKVLTEGSFFGEMAMLLSFKRTATVTALSFCEVCILTSEMFDKLILSIRDAPDFAAWIRDLVLEQNYRFKKSLKNEIESRWIRFSKIVDDLQLTQFETRKIALPDTADLESIDNSKAKSTAKKMWYSSKRP